MNGILSLGEVLDMAGRLELFLTEEEGSRIYALMDTDGDEKVNQQHLRTVYSADPFCSIRTFWSTVTDLCILLHSTNHPDNGRRLYCLHVEKWRYNTEEGSED